MPVFMKYDGVDGRSAAADSFDFTAEGGEDDIVTVLLLPAVQKVREAAARDGGDDIPIESLSLNFGEAKSGADVAMEEITLAGEDAGTDAVIFVGGWGSSSYQYANEATYDHLADDVIVDGRIITAEDWF